MMDEYLQENASLKRLLEEYEKYGRLVIAYDFDNTVYDFHKKGATYSMVIRLLQDLKDLGCIMICFTANEDVNFVRGYCLRYDIPLDKLNENPDFFNCPSRKIYYNALLDDRAGLLQVYKELVHLVSINK